MRHINKGRKFGSSSAYRKAMFSNLLASLILHERIETTLPKAKDLRVIVEKAIAAAKKGKNGLHSRIIGRYVRDEKAMEKLFATLSSRYEERAGGFVRLTKTRQRSGDAAIMALVELVDAPKKDEKQAAGKV